MRKFILMPFLFLLFGCANEVTSKDDRVDKVAIVEEKNISAAEEIESHISEMDVYSIKKSTEITSEKRIYFGKLDSYATQIVVTLLLENDKVKGQYYYSKSQKYLQLSGSLNNDSGKIELQEKYKGRVSGYFKGILTDSTFIGKWSANEKTENGINFSLYLLKQNSDNLRAENEKFMRFRHVHQSGLYNQEIDEYEPYETEDNIRINFIDDHQFDFLYKVNGMNGHRGSVSGLARMTSETEAYFSDGVDCELNFYFNNDTVKIEALNCSSYAGARAGFGGDLIRY